MEEIDEHIKEFKEYINIIIDINANGFIKRPKHQLPTFEYYKENVINDRGGKYDFTKQRYKTRAVKIEPFGNIDFQIRPINDDFIYTQKYYYKYSYWMGVPFNFKLVKELH